MHRANSSRALDQCKVLIASEAEVLFLLSNNIRQCKLNPERQARFLYASVSASILHKNIMETNVEVNIFIT